MGERRAYPGAPFWFPNKGQEQPNKLGPWPPEEAQFSSKPCKSASPGDTAPRKDGAAFKGTTVAFASRASTQSPISSPRGEPAVSAACLQRKERLAIPPARLGDSSSRPLTALHAAETQLLFSNFPESRRVPGSGTGEDRFWFPWLPNPPPVLLSKAPASCFSPGSERAAVPPGALSRHRWCRPFATLLKCRFPSSRLGGGPGSAFPTSSQVGSAKAAGPRAVVLKLGCEGEPTGNSKSTDATEILN